MRIISGHEPVIVEVPVYATGATIADGALIMLGATADTDLGLAIIGASAGTDSIGILKGTCTVAESANVGGTAYNFKKVELNDPYQIMEVEYDLTDTMAVASTSGTTVTITSLEDNIDGSWLYSTVSKNLFFLTASASGSATSKTATSWTSADTVIKILRFGHPLAKLNSAATKIGTDAAAGSWTVTILENWFEDPAGGYGPTRLDPTKHNAITLTNPRFWSKLLARNTAGHTID